MTRTLERTPAPVSASSLFAGERPRVVSIPAGAAFLDQLARGLRADCGRSGQALGDVTVYTPTRRAARALTEAFAADFAARPTADPLLPAIRALTGLDADEPPFEPGEIALSLDPAMDPMARRFLLAQLLAAKDAASGYDGDPAHELALAADLGRVMDDVARAPGADLAKVEEAWDRLPEDRQEAARFLHILATAWPALLTERGVMDAVAREVAVLATLTQRLGEGAAHGPIVAAGFTGGVAPVEDLLVAVAQSANGVVALPGLDADLDDAAWAGVLTDPQHPQHEMATLLARLGLDRRDVAAWPPDARAPAARARLVNEALRPADATADWPSRIADLAADDPTRIARGFDGLALIEAPSEEAEARAVAAAVRHALEDPGAQVAVVTPDPDVGARIAVALGRWGVEADVSAGSRLAATASGGLCALALDAAVEPGEPVALCALLKHPLAHLGRARGPRRDAVGALEARLLRGPRRDSAFDALLARAADEERLGAEALALAEDVAAALAPLLMDGEALASDWARAHASAVEALNAPAEGVGDADTAPVWADAAGEAASDLLRALIDHGDALGPLDVRAYARVFSALAADAVVRAPARAGARVRVLGPIEARLQGADVVILAGLNEGTWPAPVSQDPFLNRVMRKAAGLPPAERRLGASAHDFAQFACAPQVLLTRAARVDGQPTVASRWVWRLRTLARGAGLDEALNPPVDYLAIAEAADRRDAAPAARAVRPAARPPANARPRVMSVSSVRLWMEDPYALYAKLVLGLRPWDPLGGPLDARDAGHAIHEACARDLAGETADASTLAQTMRALYVAKGAAPDDLAREAPRFARAAAWLAEWHGARLEAGWRVALIEREGKVASDAPDFTVTARADRIDSHADDGLTVIDYKRGAVPANAEVIAAKDPQLALEAVIAAAGGFAGLAAGVPTAWLHIAASGRDPAGAEHAAAPPKPSKTNPDPPTFLPEAAKRAWAGVLEAATRYADPATPYSPPWRTIAPKAPGVVEGAYDRLSRRREWASAEGEG